jgi:hypothetical protein
MSGCTTRLIHDDVRRAAQPEAHCTGGEWTDDSSIAWLPVPIVAFVVPHANLHDIAGERYLDRCGESTRVVNREVSVNRTACIPAGLTRFITLGVWQWCPAYVSWQADVVSGS